MFRREILNTRGNTDKHYVLCYKCQPCGPLNKNTLLYCACKFSYINLLFIPIESLSPLLFLLTDQGTESRMIHTVSRRSPTAPTELVAGSSARASPSMGPLATSSPPFCAAHTAASSPTSELFTGTTSHSLSLTALLLHRADSEHPSALVWDRVKGHI